MKIADLMKTETVPKQILNQANVVKSTLPCLFIAYFQIKSNIINLFSESVRLCSSEVSLKYKIHTSKHMDNLRGDNTNVHVYTIQMISDALIVSFSFRDVLMLSDYLINSE